MKFIKEYSFIFEIAAWLLSTLAIIIVFLFTTFQTRADAEKFSRQMDKKNEFAVDSLEKRLDRIEIKIDHLIEQRSE